MPKRKKIGRPRTSRLVHVTFRADPATLDAIEKLTAAYPAGTVQPRAAAIRLALIQSAARLKGEER